MSDWLVDRQTTHGLMTANNKPKGRPSRKPGSTSSRGSQDEGGQQENNGDTYQIIDVLGSDRISMVSSDNHSYANIGVEHDEHRIEYSDPKHYDGRQGGKTRTAMNVTNLDADTLEERIRKASGIATTEQEKERVHLYL